MGVVLLETGVGGLCGNVKSLWSTCIMASGWDRVCRPFGSARGERSSWQCWVDAAGDAMSPAMSTLSSSVIAIMVEHLHEHRCRYSSDLE